MSSDPLPFEVPAPANPDPRCPCLLVLDTSGSMAGEPMDQLREGLQTFAAEVQADELTRLRVEVGVVSFGIAIAVQPFSPPGLFRPPALAAAGPTPMGAAVNQALDLVEARKREYAGLGLQYFRPLVVLMSDGAPTDDIAGATARALEAAEQKRLTLLSVGLGPNADLGALGRFSTQPARRLDGLKFVEFFRWLSRSTRVLSAAAGTAQGPLTLPPAGGWEV